MSHEIFTHGAWIYYPKCCRLSSYHDSYARKISASMKICTVTPHGERSESCMIYGGVSYGGPKLPNNINI